jgi:hypothetical protein
LRGSEAGRLAAPGEPEAVLTEPVPGRADGDALRRSDDAREGFFTGDHR